MKQIITVVRGDITEQEIDAIVNAANSSLLGGGGVDGAIHRRGGPSILRECRALRESRFPDGLPTGDAVSTTAGDLPARRVIHTVGPIWHGGTHGERELLAKAYSSCMRTAAEEGLRSVAFPSISTGAYGFPVELAAPIAMRTVRDEVSSGNFDEVRFVLFSDAQKKIFSALL